MRTYIEWYIILWLCCRLQALVRILKFLFVRTDFCKTVICRIDFVRLSFVTIHSVIVVFVGIATM